MAAGAALAAGSRVAPAQARTVSQPPVATSTLVGVVADSLHGGPLAGAVVLVDGQPREAVTDSTGRFRIDSVTAGRYRVGIFHPILDSLGTGVASPPVKLTAGRSAVVTLATPSGQTIRRAVCPDSPAASWSPDVGDSGVAVLVGHVLDPDTDEPVADVHISLMWTETYMSRAEIHESQHHRETTSDHSGEFRFCALPGGVTGLLRATVTDSATTTAIASPTTSTVTSATSVEREVDLGPRIVTMTMLHLSIRGPLSSSEATVANEAGPPATPGSSGAPAVPTNGAAAGVAPPGAAPAAGAGPAASAARGSAVLNGQVERPDGTPLPGALAEVEGTSDSALAGGDGAFTIRGLPSGTHMLVVRSVGFEPVAIPVELTRREPRTVMVVMTSATYVMSPVLVQARRLEEGYSRVGFTQRRRQGIGQFLTMEEIQQRRPNDFSDLFATTRGVTRSTLRPGGVDVVSARGIGGCVVYVIDGQPFNQIVHGEVDAMLRPDELAGIEIYTPAAVPEQFRVKSLPGTNALGVPTLGTTGCTTLVVWTKTRLGVHN